MKKYDAFVKEIESDQFTQNEPLAKHTYFKIGGPVDFFYTANTIEELISAVQLAIKHNIPYTVIGGGSNILVTNKGYRGLIIKNKSSKISLKGFAGGGGKGTFDIKHVLIQADSGVPANKLIRHTINEGLAGLEDFLGLPGSVGGAIFNNSHHIGKLIGDTIAEVEVLNASGNSKKYTQQEMKFAYDYSILHKTRETVLRATFRLKKGDKQELWQKAETAVKRRSATQPLGVPSSGCIFKNFELADAIRLGTPDQNCSSGYLIDKAGLKGEKKGGAMISDKHANFIVNMGDATYKDVMYLVDLIKEKVKESYGVDLKLEIFILGEK